MTKVALRIARLLGVLFVVSVLCFLSLELLPGDPARVILGQSATPESVEALREQLGLNDPLVGRYFSWVGNIFQGDFGRSFANSQPISQMLIKRVPISLELIAMSQVLALLAAMPLAAIAAMKQGRVADRAASVVVFFALSVPSFVFSFMLIWLFSIKFKVFPANGYAGWSDGVGQHLRTMFLPAVSLAIGPFALYQRVFRADLIETNQQEFMQVARAKGIGPVRIALRHAFRPSLFGLLTSVGAVVGALIGASVIIETIFTIPGLGSALVQSVSARDYVAVQAIVLVVATSFVLINAIVDVIYGLVDPRVRTQKRTKRAPSLPIATMSANAPTGPGTGTGAASGAPT